MIALAGAVTPLCPAGHLPHKGGERDAAIAWWDWPLDKIEANLGALERGDLAALRRA